MEPEEIICTLRVDVQLTHFLVGLPQWALTFNSISWLWEGGLVTVSWSKDSGWNLYPETQQNILLSILE